MPNSYIKKSRRLKTRTTIADRLYMWNEQFRSAFLSSTIDSDESIEHTILLECHSSWLTTRAQFFLSQSDWRTFILSSYFESHTSSSRLNLFELSQTFMSFRLRQTFISLYCASLQIPCYRQFFTDTMCVLF